MYFRDINITLHFECILHSDFTLNAKAYTQVTHSMWCGVKRYSGNIKKIQLF